MLENVRSIAETKVWGEHSLTVGGIVAFVIGIALILLHPLGTWSMWIGLAVIFAGMALF
jgi:hypothetical protein